MISNGVRDLTKRFEDDRILQHDHRVPVLREDAVLEKVAEHAKHLHHEVDLWIVNNQLFYFPFTGTINVKQP